MAEKSRRWRDGIPLLLRGKYRRANLTANTVVVRAPIPWHMRILLFCLGLLLVFVLSSWAYSAGSRHGASERGCIEQLKIDVPAELVRLQDEVARLRSVLTASESTILIERASQQQLVAENTRLAQENTRLKEDLTVIERLTRRNEPQADASIRLESFTVTTDPAKAGRYHYRFRISLQGARRGNESRFRLEFVVRPKNEKPEEQMVLTSATEHKDDPYTLNLRNYRTIEGHFDLPAGFQPGSVEIRIFAGLAQLASQRLVF